MTAHELKETPKSKKKYMRLANDKKIEEFKTSDELTLDITPVSPIPRRAKGFFHVKYEKEIKKVGSGFIYIIKKNGTPISFVWKTKRENLKEAVKEGVYKPEALTAQVISAMGKYRSKVLEQVYESGIISNKYHEKKELLDFSQRRVELLQPLERLINSRVELKEVVSALQKYMDDVENYKKEFQCNHLVKYDVDVRKKFENYLEADIVQIREIQNRIRFAFLDSKSFLKSDGINSLRLQLRLMIIDINKQAQTMNQNLTYARSSYVMQSSHEMSSGFEKIGFTLREAWKKFLSLFPESLFRGDFNHICEEVMMTIDSHEPDLHNAVTVEHQGDFSKSKDEYVCLEFSTNDKAALAAICKIEGVDRIECEKDELVFTKADKMNVKTVLNTTRFMQYSSLWHSFERKSEDEQNQTWGEAAIWFLEKTMERVLSFVSNVSTGIVYLIPDIVLGTLGGLFDFEFSLVEYLKIYRKIERPEAHYFDLSNAMKVKNKPFAFSIFLFIGATVRSAVSDMLWGAVLIAQQIAKIPKIVISDYHVGGWGDKSETLKQVFSELDANIKTIQGEMEASGLTLVEEKRDCHFARPPYMLSAGEWNDVSVLPKGIKSFGNTILSSVHYSSPVRGFIYNFLYYIGFGTIIAPQHLNFMPDFYKEVSAKLGMQMAHGIVGQGISNAVTQAQGSAWIAEIFEKGPNSFIGQMVTKLESNLVDIAVITLIARTFGGVLEKLPGVGHVINEELGSSKNAGLVTYAAKIAILLKEIFEKGETGEVSEELIDETKKLIKEFQKISPLPEEQKLIDSTHFMLKLMTHSELLPHLPVLSKRKLIQQAQRLFPDQPEMVTAVENMLYPDPPYSIAARTLHILGKYLSTASRLIFSPLTGNIKQPLRDAKKIISKDLVRLVRCLHNFFEVIGLLIYATGYSMGRAIADCFWNGIFARIEALIRGNKHSLSQGSVGVATFMSRSYYQMGAIFSGPVNQMSHAVTSQAPVVVVHEHFGKLFEGSKKEMQYRSASVERTGDLLRVRTGKV